MILGILEVQSGGSQLILSTGQTFRVPPEEACKVCHWCASQHVCVRRIDREEFEIFNFETHESIHALVA